MKAVALTCGHCGGAIDAPESVKFLTCSYCGARLQIQRTEGAVYTEVMEAVARVDAKASGAAAEVERIKAERELEKVDAELAKLKDPGGWWVVWMCVGFAVVGLLLAIGGNTDKGKAAGLLNLFLFGILGLFLGIAHPGQVRTYQEQKTKLDAARLACKQRLQSLQ